MTTTKRFPSGLYAVTPDWDDIDKLLAAVNAAAAAGITALQLRHKTANPAQRHDLARALLTACRAWGVPLLINDDWQLAKAIGADGVHLGKDDENPARVRAELGDSYLLGVSCYGDLDRAQQMIDIGVDYVAFGAMFASGTKPHAEHVALDTLAAGRALIERCAPQTTVVAIGGITTDNAASVLTAGADSLAVIGGLFNANNIETTVRAFNALMN